MCHGPYPFLFDHSQHKLFEIILLLRKNIVLLLRANSKLCCLNGKDEGNYFGKCSDLSENIYVSLNGCHSALEFFKY